MCKERSICLGSQEERQENAGQWSICGVLHIKHAAPGWLYSDRRALWFQLIDYRRFYSQPTLNMEFTQIITNHIVSSLSIFPAVDHIILGIQLWIIETGWNPVWHSAVMACHWIDYLIFYHSTLLCVPFCAFWLLKAEASNNLCSVKQSIFNSHLNAI